MIGAYNAYNMKSSENKMNYEKLKTSLFKISNARSLDQWMMKISKKGWMICNNLWIYRMDDTNLWKKMDEDDLRK